MDWTVPLQATASEQIFGLNSTAFAIVFGLFTLVAGIVASWLVSWYYYRRSRDKHRLVWTNFTAMVADTFTTHNRNVGLSYLDQPVTSIAISWLIVWNNGIETVHRDDLVQDDPIRIEPSSGNKILAVQIVSLNNSSSKFEIVTTSSSAAPVIYFDFLLPSNGAVFQVTHTGRSTSAIQLVGALKTDPQPQRVELTADRFRALPPTGRARMHEMPGTGWITFLFVAFMMIVALGGGVIIFSVFSDSLCEPWSFASLLVWVLVCLAGSVRLMFMLEQRVGPSIPGGLQVLADGGESTTEYWDRRLPPDRRFPLA